MKAIATGVADQQRKQVGHGLKMAKVSVIIPTRNRTHMLQKAIHSARDAGSSIEIVVVDDASTDETESVCRKLGDITYLRMNRNVGQARARNVGIEHSHGEYLAFLDDDDVRLPGSIDLQLELLSSDDQLGFVYGPVYIADAETSLPTGEIRPNRVLSGDIYWNLINGNFIYICSVLARRRSMEAIGLFSPDVLGTEDWDAWIRLAATSKVGAVHEPVAVYRDFTRHSGQTSSNRRKMCRAGARTLDRALKLPRASEMDRNRRQEIRLKFKHHLWNELVTEGELLLSQGKISLAIEYYATVIRLWPTRAMRLRAFTNFFRSVRFKLNE